MPFRFNPFTHKLDLTGITGIPPGTVATLTGNEGGAVGPDGSNNINILGGSGIDVSGNPGTNTLTITSTASPVLPFTEVVTPTQNMAVDQGYVSNDGASLVTFTLPATAAFGTVLAVVGKGSGLFSIAQNAGQIIHFGDFDTTTGTGGSVSSNKQYCVIYLLCTAEDTDFTVTDSISNFTIV